MGQAESTVIRIREMYDALDVLRDLARIADEGFMVHSGDVGIPIPPQQVASMKDKFREGKDKLRSLVASLHEI